MFHTPSGRISGERRLCALSACTPSTLTSSLRVKRSSTCATTKLPSLAEVLRSTTARSPSKMPASIIESPCTGTTTVSAGFLTREASNRNGLGLTSTATLRWPACTGGFAQRVFEEAPHRHPGIVIHGTHHKTFRFHAPHELHRRRARGKAQQISNALVTGYAAVLREVLTQGVQVVGVSVGVAHGNIQDELFAIIVNNSTP